MPASRCTFQQNLFVAILVDAVNQLDQTIRRSAQVGLSTREQLGQLVRALFAQSPEQRAIVRLAGHEMMHLDDAAGAQFGQLYQEKFICRLQIADCRLQIERRGYAACHGQDDVSALT